MKCALCKKAIETTFLSKLVGTQVRNSKGKKHGICKECQQKNSIEEIKKKLS